MSDVWELALVLLAAYIVVRALAGPGRDSGRHWRENAIEPGYHLYVGFRQPEGFRVEIDSSRPVRAGVMTKGTMRLWDEGHDGFLEPGAACCHTLVDDGFRPGSKLFLLIVNEGRDVAHVRYRWL